jgi:hypothetical protein
MLWLHRSIGALEARMVNNCRLWWRRWSVWLAAVSGAITSVIVANQGLLISLLAYLPTGFFRLLIAVSIGFVVFVVPTITVLLKQKNLDG